VQQHELFAADGAQPVEPASSAGSTASRPVTHELRHGRWQDVLADVECDALIMDPPYGDVTHAGNAERLASMGRARLSYAAWTAADVVAFVEFWSPRCRGWLACMTSDDLIPVYRAAYRSVGRKDFAPVPVLQHRPRLSGDGPGSGAVYLVVSRPRSDAFMGWGSLPCWYHSQPARDGVAGGKPLDLMRAIVRDYSRPGDLICDPCAGAGTTLLAARIEGRSSIGAELDEKHYAIAQRRLARGYTPSFDFGETA
jgi:site-specific DNA-methyltransferase (adenine-specific)